MNKIKEKINTIPDWPKKGITFCDITTLIKDPEGLKICIDNFYERYKEMKIGAVVGIEARGFIVGSVLAYLLGVGFIPIRKKGKLPGKVIKKEYALEYGTDTIEIHEDSIKKGERVLLIDDLIATGGTMLASCELLELIKVKIVECACIIDIPDVGGSKKLKIAGYKVYSQVKF